MRKLILIIICFCAALACEPETFPTSFGEHKSEDRQAICLNFQAPIEFETKSSLPGDIETKLSGAILAIYDSQTDALEKVLHLGSSDLNSSYKLWLPKDRNYDFYLLANLWKINSTTDEPEYLDLPTNSEEMKSYVYRLDGAALDSNFRRERFEDLSVYGLPMYWSRTDVNSLTIGRMDIVLQRIFSKLVLTIDHSGIAGTRLEDFVNGSVCIKQINNRLSPFSEYGSLALTNIDILPIGDCESEIENKLVKELVFYVPENRQGTLMPSNTDPNNKDINGIEAATGHSGKSALATYIEFQGNISSYGISTKAIYRFFLGSNATSNFDIVGNESYNISLSFNAESIFIPQWKVETRDFSDTRLFYLSANLAGRLPDGKTIVVRENRAAKVDLNLNMSSGTENRILNTKLVNADYQALELGDLAWTSDFYSATHNTANEPQRAVLNDYGIDVTYSNGAFTFSVTDPSRFVIGQSIPISLTLFPGNKKINAIIKTSENMVVREKDGKSLTSDFYIYQKRSLEIKGFEGKVYYAGIQDKVGHSHYGFLKSENYQWKTSNSTSAPFPRIKKNGDTIIYPYQNPSLYSSQSLDTGEDLDIYTFWPNNFLNVYYSGSIYNKMGTIIVCSDDVLNDDIYNLPINIDLPVVQHLDYVNTVELTLDGEEYQLASDFYHIYSDKTVNKREMYESEFDPVLFDRYLRPSLVIESESEWSSCLKFDEESKTVYVNKTTIGSRKIEDEVPTNTRVAQIKFKQNNNSGLLANNQITYLIKLISPTLSVSEVVSPSINYFNSESTDGVIHYRAKVYYSLLYRDHNLEYSVRGKKMKVSLYGNEYEAITHTNIEVPSAVNYGTVKAIIDYIYNETDQPLVTSSGKGLPAGLLVPYGEHQFVASLVNKWDGRTMDFTADFDINYELDLYQFAFYWQYERNAGILMVTPKNIAYIKKNFSKMNAFDQLHLVRVLGTNIWNHSLASSNSYHYIGGPGAITETLVGLYESFDVKFYKATASYWTDAIIADSTTDVNYKWLDNLSLERGFGDYVTETSDPFLCGNSAIKKLTLHEEKGGWAKTITPGFGNFAY